MDFEPVLRDEIYVEMINSYEANLFPSLIKPETTAQQQWHQRMQ